MISADLPKMILCEGLEAQDASISRSQVVPPSKDCTIRSIKNAPPSRSARRNDQFFKGVIRELRKCFNKHFRENVPLAMSNAKNKEFYNCVLKYTRDIERHY